MPKSTPNTFYPKTLQDWRNWLEENHKTESFVWLILHNKKSNQPTISWSEAVDEALCFGWIDSKKQTIDDTTYRQYYCPRKASSIWSKINKEKVDQLQASGRMTEAGLACVRTAKQNGMWTFYDHIENLIVPDDLEQALSSQKNALEFYENLSPSKKKQVLYWVASAKREETRMKRIEEIVEQAGLGGLPKGIQ